MTFVYSEDFKNIFTAEDSDWVYFSDRGDKVWPALNQMLPRTWTLTETHDYGNVEVAFGEIVKDFYVRNSDGSHAKLTKYEYFGVFIDPLTKAITVYGYDSAPEWTDTRKTVNYPVNGGDGAHKIAHIRYDHTLNFYHFGIKHRQQIYASKHAPGIRKAAVEIRAPYSWIED